MKYTLPKRKLGATSISVQGQQFPVDQDGNFEAPAILASTLKAMQCRAHGEPAEREKVRHPDVAPVPVVQSQPEAVKPGPVTKTTEDMATVKAARDARVEAREGTGEEIAAYMNEMDHNAMGTWLKEHDMDVPPSKDARFNAILAALKPETDE